MNNDSLEIVHDYKYLGIWLHYSLNNNTTIEKLALRGSRALSQIIGKTKEAYNLNYESFTTLFTSMVCPILDYGCGAWNSGTDCKKLDQVQMRAIRYFCGPQDPRTSPICGLEGDMG